MAGGAQLAGELRQHVRCPRAQREDGLVGIAMVGLRKLDAELTRARDQARDHLAALHVAALAVVRAVGE